MLHYPVTVAVGATSLEVAAQAVLTLMAPLHLDIEAAQQYDSETGDYHWWNPRGTWNGCEFGGRWAATLRVRGNADPRDVIPGQLSPANLHRPLVAGFATGGRIRALDLNGQRDDTAELARVQWEDFQRIVAGTPAPRPWSEFAARAKDAEAAAEPWLPIREQILEACLRWRNTTGASNEEYGRRVHTELEAAAARWEASLTYSMRQAARDYHDQPRITALNAHASFSGFPLTDPELVFGETSRENYLVQRRLEAIPGSATLTHDGRWLCSGPLDDHGLPTGTAQERHDYLAEANDYIDGLSEDMWLVVMDCHA
ncbi:hypothetical protein LZ318_30880 [Saccharopolyspora indica]|uniref:hypothetical protein n=1 Tax=Saccharopolyspora indica TaxID=1229659 RepID=UPI0022EA2921|nr:hypothetical protein [Saccharopolyspora indica]MDA3644362.1 hypothetical protein [Saccharopolyspora indica]